MEERPRARLRLKEVRPVVEVIVPPRARAADRSRIPQAQTAVEGGQNGPGLVHVDRPHVHPLLSRVRGRAVTKAACSLSTTKVERAVAGPYPKRRYRSPTEAVSTETASPLARMAACWASTSRVPMPLPP